MTPFAIPSSFNTRKDPKEESEHFSLFVFQDNELLIDKESKTTIKNLSLPLKRKIHIGSWNQKQIFAAELSKNIHIPETWIKIPLRSLHGLLSEEECSLAGRAASFLHWDRSHTYCGCCGHSTFARDQEHCKECSSCGHLFYPQMTPAIMALVKKEGKILLARSPHFPENLYSVLAGFVELGETLEQCVAREVAEETGIQVKNIKYFASQPWPISHLVMVGFTCEWESGELSIDQEELVDAAWFSQDKLPIIPPHISLARFLIDSAFL